MLVRAVAALTALLWLLTPAAASPRVAAWAARRPKAARRRREREPARPAVRPRPPAVEAPRRRPEARAVPAAARPRPPAVEAPRRRPVGPGPATRRASPRP